MANILSIKSIPELSTSSLLDTNNTTVIDVDKIGNNSRYNRRQLFFADRTSYTTDTTWIPASKFPVVHDFKAGSNLFLYYTIPMRNDETTWGGAYIEPQVRIMSKNLITNSDLNTGWSKQYASNIVFNEIAPPVGITAQTVSFDNAVTTNTLYWYCYDDYVPMAPGSTFKISLYAKISSGSANISAYTADNAEVGRYSTEQVTVDAADGWKRVEFAAFVNPSNSEAESISIRWDTPTAGQRVSLCAPMMEEGSVMSDFVDGTTEWKSLGSSGYDGGVMGYGGRINTYRNFLTIDPQKTEEFSAQFRFYYRAYNGTTASWNGSRNQGTISGLSTRLSGANDDEFYSCIHLKEYALLT